MIDLLYRLLGVPGRVFDRLYWIWQLGFRPPPID